MVLLAGVVLGFVAWYVLYSVECMVNGGDGDWLMAFRCAWDDLRFNLPGGWARRMAAVDGDDEWAGEFPGWGHILTMHVAIPVGVCYGVVVLGHAFGLAIGL
jgi:hypothetical protein